MLVYKYKGDFMSENINNEKEKLEKENVAPIQEKPEYDFLLPQFSSVEEQAKSYKELQALQTKQAQELAKYKKQNNLELKRKEIKSNLEKLENDFNFQQDRIKTVYFEEMKKLENAYRSGKINSRQKMQFLDDLNNYFASQFQNLKSLYQDTSQKYSQLLDLATPQEFFAQDQTSSNVYPLISEFLENNYHQLPKQDLENIKSLVGNLREVLREEILKELEVDKENENYRKSLTSATSFSPETGHEKIYTMSEIKSMRPEEFRKNQNAILEQFASNKLK